VQRIVGPDLRRHGRTGSFDIIGWMSSPYILTSVRSMSCAH
jgi:hypothetical protein